MIQRALISVYDKSGLRELVDCLLELNPSMEILSTGGTARMLREWKFPVTDVSEYTGSPEVFQGRVKTLHPRIEGGILMRRNQDEEEAASHHILPIDMVVCNLYPFEEKSALEGISDEALMEEVDVGGPTMIRAAAKSYRDVIILANPSAYPAVMQELRENGGNISAGTRKNLALEAFSRTAAYDSFISSTLKKRWLGAPSLHLVYEGGTPLRYGENWHQEAMAYFGTTGFGRAKKLAGKETSFNNYLDFEAALSTVIESPEAPAAVVIKHNNPCGFATGDSLNEALIRAFEGDPTSAFGGVLAFNERVDAATAGWLEKRFVEGIIAPGFDDDALSILLKKANLILLELPDIGKGKGPGPEYRFIWGGILQQQPDDLLVKDFKCVTAREFPAEKKELALFAYKAAKHIKSNAISIVREYKKGRYQIMGIGAGQPNRVQSVMLAVEKTKENLLREFGGGSSEGTEDMLRGKIHEMVMGSDAFFPFADGVELAAQGGIRAIIQPGGSQRDSEVIEMCNRMDVAMVMTGVRHFKH